MPIGEAGDDAGIVVLSEDDWPAAAEAWRPGDPFPLLDDPALGRHRTRLGAAGFPDVVARQWPGVVLSIGAPRSRAVGALLARASGRPHHHAGVREAAESVRAHGDMLVAVVAHLDDFDEAGDWLQEADARVGLLTARSTAALLALIYRTLTTTVTGDQITRRLTHPTLTGAVDADVIGFDDLPVLTDGRANLLLLRTHGRECCLHLPDSVICGRSAPPTGRPEPIADGMRAPSCTKGAGCFRTDVPDARRVPARDLTGDVVLTHSCNPVAVGVNAMPHEVNIALGLIEGTAVAVLGAVGRHMGDPAASDLIEAGLARGARLGDILRELNALGRGMMGERSRFGLLGDPAFALTEYVPMSAAPHRGTAQPAAPTPAADLLRLLAGEVIPALYRLCWLEVPLTTADLAGPITEVREAHVRQLDGARDVAAAAAAAAVHVAELQRDLIARYSTIIHTTWWQFMSAPLGAMRESSSEPIVCPHCGRGSARTVGQRDTLAPWLEVTADLCRRCGMLRWQSGESVVEYTAGMDFTLRARSTTRFPLELRNTSSRPVTVATGFAFVNGEFHHLPGPVTTTVDLAPGERRTVHASCELPAPHRNPDVFEAAFVSCADGVLTVLPAWVSIDNTTLDPRPDELDAAPPNQDVIR